MTGNDSDPTGYTVTYVPVVYHENTAEPVPIAGGVVLQVIPEGTGPVKGYGWSF